MYLDGGISAEALAFSERMTPDPAASDFDRIVEIRVETRAGYAAGSERAIERHDLEIDEVERGGVTCSRIKSRRAGTSNGTLFYVFGGAFVVGDPYSDLRIIGALAEYGRVEVIAPHYRLAPEHPAPAAGDDCIAAYAEISSTPQRLLVAGESAGGNLALLVAQRARDEGLRSPSALALLSPGVDLRTDPELFGPTWGADPSLAPSRLDDVTRAYVVGADPTDPAISPLFGSMSGLPPTIITTGSRDLFLAMCLRLETKMRRSGVEVECRVWAGLWHVFEFYDDFPESGESLAEIAAFLNAH